MHPELEKKFKLFIDEQLRLMEEFMGPFALQYFVFKSNIAIYPENKKEPKLYA